MGSVPTPTPTTGSGMSNNLAAALCYIPLCLVGIILAIVFLLIEPYKNDRFVRFNAFQSIFLHVGLIVFSIAWQIVVVILGFISKKPFGVCALSVARPQGANICTR